MVDSAANILLETLRDLLIEEIKFLSHVSDDVKKAEADLRTIHALLMEADAKRSRADSPTIRICIDDLRELAFRAENILETYVFEVESKKQGKSLKKKLQRFMCVLCECYTVHQVGNEIDDIRSRLAELTGKLSSISGGGEGPSYSAQQEETRKFRLTYSHEQDQYFVGMEKEIEDVVSLVKDDSTSAIAICGMGGLGKTTLARKIYHNRDVRGRFDRHAWVCVTQQFQAETILREIFQQIEGSKPNETLDALVRGLHDVLVQNKCLVVIDDIWETCHWEILKKAFPRENCKVVLTTRNENIASHGCHLHKLRFLTEDEGWELLGKIALPHGQDVRESTSKQFEETGRRLVQECGCLPLAISVIGGILRGKQPHAWVEVSRNMDIYLRHGGEGMGDDIRVKQVLDLSFDVLPYYLKPCFLYLTCFPEDYDIDTERLYLLWLAEGLISSEERGKNESLRDVAERYLTELAFRCMVQVKKSGFTNPFKKFESCRLHDLMRDLCSSKAEHEKFIKRVDVSQHQQDISSTVGASVHRLAINVVDEDLTLHENCLHEVKDLRSLLVFQKENYGIRTQSCFINAKNLENSKHLRILGVDRVLVEDRKFMSGIDKLIYLKYLSFFDCDLKVDSWLMNKILELPEDVFLPFLQTLDLRVRYSIKLPNLIWKMKRLRHLFLPYFIYVTGGGKLRLAGLEELETLEGINNRSVRIEDIINLTSLRTLRAEIHEEDVDILSKIVDFMKFQLCEADLQFESCDLKNVIEKTLMMRSLVRLAISYKIGCSFPSYKEGMCQNLVKLEISVVKIGIDVIEAFGKYPMLEHLYLHIEFEEGMVEMRFAANSFLKLKELQLFDLKNLHTWEVENGAMPQLRHLSIGKCEDLEKLPDGLRFISTLDTVYLHQMPENFKTRLMKGGEDDGKFSNIPYFNFM